MSSAESYLPSSGQGAEEETRTFEDVSFALCHPEIVLVEGIATKASFQVVWVT